MNLKDLKNKLDRVISVGNCTYIRLYPNPGIGIRVSPKYRVALSVHRGFEVFYAPGAPQGVQQRRLWRLVYRRLNRKLVRV